jgi:hypothetical protein
VLLSTRTLAAEAIAPGFARVRLAEMVGPDELRASRIEMSVNLTTAKVLGIDIPPTLLVHDPAGAR